jgi:hypothetical protein
LIYFYLFEEKKVYIFQDLNQGPLGPKLLTLLLDHEVSSEDRKKTSKVIVQSNQVMAGDSKIQKLQIIKPLCRVIELHIGKMRPFLLITSLVPSLGPPISPKRSKYDITFSY